MAYRVNMAELKKRAEAMPEEEPDNDECPYEGTEVCESCKYFMDPCWGGLFPEEDEDDENNN